MTIPAPTSESAARVATIGTVRSFKYEAQTLDGKRITGVVDADDPEWVSRQLATLRLRLLRLDPVGPADAPQDAASQTAADAPSRPRGGGPALRGVDFIAFNQQLAHLAKAGLPIESGLRLIARDMRSGRLATTIKSVADELDQGVPIGEAFEKHRGRFPSLYGRLLDAGIASGDLAGVLLGFGAHLEMLQRLRAALWRALSYPLAVLAALAVVMLFLGHYVLPRFAELYAGMAMDQIYDYRSHSNRHVISPSLPLATQVLLGTSQAIPYLAGLLLACIVLGPLVWRLLRLLRLDTRVTDAVALRLPMVGRPIRLNLVARWCDVMRIGTSAGLPLPKAIDLAADAIRSPRLRHDGQILINCLENGLPLSSLDSDYLPTRGVASGKLSVLPATVPAAIELSSGHNDLPSTLGSLAELYERQAELRVNAIPVVLSPLMVIAVAIMIGFVVMALMLPLAAMLEGLGK